METIDTNKDTLPAPVPYIIHETDMARMDLSHRRVEFLLGALLALSVLANIAIIILR